MSVCRICNCQLSDSNWYPSLRKRNSQLCKACNLRIGNEHRRNNPEHHRAYSRKYYQEHPKYNVPWGRQNRIDIREEMIRSYGGKCVSCGIDNPIVLDIDHVDNSGAKHRRNGMWGWRLYRWLRKNNYPKDNYQLLCRNCNWLKEIKRRKAITEVDSMQTLGVYPGE